MTSYSIPEISAHMKATGLDFHAAHADLQEKNGPANPTYYPCSECGEVICREPDTLCSACLFPDEE